MPQSPAAPAPADVTENVLRWLASPHNHQRLTALGDELLSPDGAFQGSVRDGVAVMMNSNRPSFFDDRFEIMQRGHQSEGERALCYSQQTALFRSYLKAGDVVLDVGCGPSLPYERPPGTFVIGLEPSFHSIRANRDVDLRVYGSAEAIPMADSTVDSIVCFYSIHHMVGNTIEETRQNVARAFKEFGRVLKPNGHLFIFEMTPITFFSWAQSALWNWVRKIAPAKLDMYFWSANDIATLGERQLPPGSMLEKIFFGASAFTVIPPAFSLPWLRVPRFVYPLDAKLYKWKIEKPSAS